MLYFIIIWPPSIQHWPVDTRKNTSPARRDAERKSLFHLRQIFRSRENLIFQPVPFLYTQYIYRLLSELLLVQDIDDWDDVGVNTPRPPNLLHLFRDYGKHVMEPVEKDKEEIEKLKEQIWQLVSGIIKIRRLF